MRRNFTVVVILGRVRILVRLDLQKVFLVDIEIRCHLVPIDVHKTLERQCRLWLICNLMVFVVRLRRRIVVVRTPLTAFAPVMAIVVRFFARAGFFPFAAGKVNDNIVLRGKMLQRLCFGQVVTLESLQADPRLLRRKYNCGVGNDGHHHDTYALVLVLERVDGWFFMVPFFASLRPHPHSFS